MEDLGIQSLCEMDFAAEVSRVFFGWRLLRSGRIFAVAQCLSFVK
jgi:hypothetical protein